MSQIDHPTLNPSPSRGGKLLEFLIYIFLVLTPLSATAEKHLTIGSPMLPPTYGNPHQNVSLPGTLPLFAVFDTLTKIGGDGTPQPALATSWEAISDTTWVLTLRDGITFSNGEPFNADAVIAAFDYLLGEGKSETIGTHLTRIHVTGARALDSRTVEITTAQPNAILPIHLDFMRIPAPAEFAAVGPDAFALNPVGTGPLKVEAWEDSRIRLVRNETAWRPPKVDRVTLIGVPDQASRLQGLLSGSLDVAMNVPPDTRPAVERAGGRLISYVFPNVSYLQFVTVKESPLQDVRVRRALNYAVNKDLILQVLFDGAAVPAGQIAHPQSFGFNPDVEAYPYDPERAKALLAEAGYPDGFEMDSLMAGNRANDREVQQLVAADLARIGITMTVQHTTFAQYLEYMYQTGYPDTYVSFAMTTSGFDPMHGFRTRSCRWMTAYHCDPDAMPLIDAAERATTPDERRARVQALMAYEHDNPSGLYLWQNPTHDALGPNVTAFTVIADGVPFHEVDVRE